MLDRDASKRAIWLTAAMRSCLSPTEQELMRLAAQLMDRLADLPAAQNSETKHAARRITDARTGMIFAMSIRDALALLFVAGVLSPRRARCPNSLSPIPAARCTRARNGMASAPWCCCL